MRLLLDTHAFLWAIDQPARLSAKARRVLLDEGNELWLSTATLWEIALKCQAGKLQLPAAAEFLQTHMQKLGVTRVLAVEPTHIYRLLTLPSPHKDPFDRLLIAQCLVEDMAVLSKDRAFRRYQVRVVW